jgi:hypothetical protein
MSRFTLALIAAATAAIAAIAVVALPAIGDSGGKQPPVKTDDTSAFAACLAQHGLPGAPTTGENLKPWIARKEAVDPQATHAALDACKRSVPDGSAPGPSIEDIVKCVQNHGVDAPTAPEDFKRWVGEQEQAGNDAVERALVACKMALAPPGVKPGDKGKPSDCGDTAPAKPPADAKPPTDGDTTQRST